MEQQTIIIAIDGCSGTGKSTLAKHLADRLGFLYIDSGAMYRAVTYYFLKHGVDLTNHRQIQTALKNISINFKKDDNGSQQIFLNGENVETQIRSMQVAGKVSDVAAIPEVRSFAVALQRTYPNQTSVVMDGRDIGTTVFPKAQVKIFMTADDNVRAQRRFDEMLQKNPAITLKEVEKNLQRRDYIDSHRVVSPLKKASDAVIIDNTNLTPDEQLSVALSYVAPLL